MSETYFQKVVRGSAYYFIGAFIAAGVAYLIRLLLARSLPLEDFGLFYAVFNVVLLLGVFKTVGMPQAITKFIPEYLAKKKYGKIKSLLIQTFVIQLVFSLLLVVILWFVAGFLADVYFGDPRAAWLLRVVSFYLPVKIIFMNLKAYFQGFQRRVLFAVTEPLYNILVLVSVSVGLFIGLGVFAPAVAYLAANILLFIVLFYFVLKTFNFFKYTSAKDPKYTRYLLIFGIPLAITGMGSVVISYFDTLMLTYYTSLEVVGVYNVVYPSAMIFSIFAVSITSVLFPIISELWAKKDYARLKAAMSILYKYVFALGIPLLIVFFVFAEVFLKLFFGSDFVVGATAFRILLVGILFKFLVYANQNYLTGIGATKKVMWFYIAGSLFNVIANFMLIPRFGMNGAAFASALSFFLMMIVSYFFVGKSIGIVAPIGSWVLTFLASGFFFGSVYFLKELIANPWVAGFVGLAVGFVLYVLFLLLVRVFDVKEVMSLVRQVR